MRYHPALGLLPVIWLGCANPSRVPEAGRDARGQNGAVTADHPLAARAGLAVLQQGGNAMDAAITMAAVLSVARPHMNGLGGDMFLLYYDAKTSRVYGLNASGPAGSRASIERVRAQQRGDRMPEVGPLTVTVPGAVRGWAEALQRFGTRSWQDVLQPAVELARRGLPVSERLAADIEEERPKVEADSVAARIYLPGGKPPAAGSLLRQEELAATLERLQQAGPDEVYTGETGRRLASYLEARGGFLAPEDLARYRPEWVEPLFAEYRGLTVAAMPPNSQGVTLLEELLLLSRFDLARLGHNSADYLHTLAEAIRIAAADRDTSVADPRAMRVAVSQLLDPDRLSRLAQTIQPAGRAPAVAARAGLDQPNTVYIIAVDRHGNVASMIQSLYASFGSGLVVPGTGVVLHNRGALFSLDPRHPNALAPGKRPYHTLCPALVLDRGTPWLALGTPGGDGQTHTLIQVLNNIVLFGMSPQEAIDAPRLRRLESGTLAIEDRVPGSVIHALEERGYRVSVRTGLTATFGGAQAVLLDAKTGEKRAGADRRREAFALAY
jgi:gamma-glutamyltranspeptidase/glutathione hydrolase